MANNQINQALVDQFYTIGNNGKRTLDEGLVAQHIAEEWHSVYYDGLLYDKTGEVLSKGCAQAAIYKLLRDFGVISNLKVRTMNIWDGVKYESMTDRIEVAPNQIAVKNGTVYVDLKTGDISFSSEKNFSLNRLNVEYNEAAKPPTTFLKWFHDLIPEEDYLGFQQYMGYLLLPTTKVQKALILLGRGQEGKSVIGKVLHYLFGASCVSSDVSYFENNQFAMPRAENKLVLFCDDLKRDKLKSTETFKSMVTAEVPLQAEKKGENAYSFTPYARWLICSNAPLSSLYDVGFAFYRRLYVIRVKNKPPDRVNNPNIFEPMKSEMEGIFLWCLAGLQSLIENGWKLSISDSSQALVEEQQYNEDPTVSFVENEISFGKGYSITDKELYEKYKTYCYANKAVPRSRPDLVNFFSEQMDNLKIKRDRHLGASRGQAGFVGMGLKKTINLTSILGG